MVDTVVNSDCVEFCPSEAPHLVVCACYQINEETRERVGRVYLNEVVAEKSGEDTKYTQRNLQALYVDGIFDCKWNTNAALNPPHPNLGTVDSNGCLKILELASTESNSYELVHKSTTRISEDEKNMGLSLDWSCRLSQTYEPQIATSSSNGTIAIWSVCYSLNCRLPLLILFDGLD